MKHKYIILRKSPDENQVLKSVLTLKLADLRDWHYRVRNTIRDGIDLIIDMSFTYDKVTKLYDVKVTFIGEDYIEAYLNQENGI